MNTSKQRELDRLKRLSQTLDSAYKIPGTGIRFGVDSMIGLIPGVGDVATAAISGYIVLRARELGADNWTIARMLGNIGLDVAVGWVPLIGDLFDVGWKCNTRNVQLLERKLNTLDLARREAAQSAA